jgi:hypothetical protein
MKRCIRCNYRARTTKHITGDTQIGYVCRDPRRCQQTRKRKGIDK